MNRLPLFVVCAAALVVLGSPLAGPAGASSPQRATSHGHRVGGYVRTAWPRSGRAPKSRQARWLARQVGVRKVRACAKQWRHARTRCHLHSRIHATAAKSGSVKLPLALVRSYEVPADDPAYHRLLNWSWTYDSAVSAAAFAVTGDKANSAQLLDQLAALQYTDGSLEIAFNTVTGEGAQVFRSGTVAWFGLAAATYDKAFDSNHFLDTEQAAADYLLSLQTSNGLIKGGPSVTWVSTQHNLIAYVFLARLATELQAAGKTTAASGYQKAASAIAAAISANLLVSDASGAHFRQGVGDDTQALDVQALGAMFLQGTGQSVLAAKVLAYAQSTFAVGNHSVKTSSDPAGYNMSYAAPGPFAGYAPYAGTGAPDVLWAEASGQMRLAQAALGQDTATLDASIAKWAAITKDTGPLQADRAVTNDTYGVEYHVWPASTTAAWTVLAQSAPAFFAAPLPQATTLVTNWTKVRGGSLFTTYPDGRIAMTGAGGERRALDTSAPAADYTVTSNATLKSGTGYGIYVRAGVDSHSALGAYCVELDHGTGTGEIVVREILNDYEFTLMIAHTPVPAGFTWYGAPHVLAVTMLGNTMNITLDGVQQLSVPDLATASAASVKKAYGPNVTMTPPLSGGYGLRAWSDGLVTLQQMTVAPAG